MEDVRILGKFETAMVICWTFSAYDISIAFEKMLLRMTESQKVLLQCTRIKIVLLENSVEGISFIHH